MDITKLSPTELGHYINNRLKAELPGETAHRYMAPYGRNLQLQKKSIPRDSAVLIGLYPDQEWKTCFIQRPQYDGVHSAQIAFPGGGREQQDPDIISTALREAYEEVNINPRDVKIKGILSPIYIPPSNYHVTPVIGIMEQKPAFIPQPSEVESIIEVPLDKLMNYGTIVEKSFYTGTDKEVIAPCFNISGTIIWGATAMILYEFISMLK
ncbi:MAG: CoA pyrophosphatase [Bacteroidales bacterium]|nr:CoA pyrophosphatase [Bacteroidales bacterium]